MNNIPFAARFEDPAGSPIRELFPYLARPGMISFAGGYPSPALFDADGLRDSAARAMADSAGCLQYGATEGSPLLREALAELCAARGVGAGASDMMVTTGSQQAFDLLVRVFVEPGDLVYVETPAYPAAIQALRLAGARIEEVPVDESGLQTDTLQRMLDNAPPGGKPKLLYTVPTFSNPCGTLLPGPRREALVRLAAEHQFAVIEDDPYGELAFTDERPPSLHAIGRACFGAANPVIYLSSLSKTVAPALRIGWMVAPQDVLRRCAIAKQTSDLCTSPVAQLIANDYLRSGRYPACVARACAEYQKRMRAMVDALGAATDGQLTFVEPKGGMFLWARSRAPLDARRFFDAAVNAGVVYVPGAAFYPNTPDLDTMRLSYAAPDLAQIAEGAARFGKAYRSAAQQVSAVFAT